MKGREFLGVAQQLAGAATEAEWRSGLAGPTTRHFRVLGNCWRISGLPCRVQTVRTPIFRDGSRTEVMQKRSRQATTSTLFAAIAIRRITIFIGL
jgi:hypothetical protein